jgi:hypothetical protein
MAAAARAAAREAQRGEADRPVAGGDRQLARAGCRGRQDRPESQGFGLGTKRWVVERTISWLHRYRRLRIGYERRNDIHEAFLTIGCSLICLKLLRAQEPFC